MYRKALDELKKWRITKGRKPLIICGARQTGKTWLMKEFGRTEYKRTVYLNCENNPELKNIFSENITPSHIIEHLGLLCGVIDDPENTLIIIDEIQEIPRALVSLKYFCEDAPQYNIICAGSLLGIALHHGISFPVGKVSFLKLYPLSFTEFLRACGKDMIAEYIESADAEKLKTLNLHHGSIAELVKWYCYIGGMPEVVDKYIQTHDPAEVRRIQKEIITAYEQDFSKHAPVNTVPRIRLIWESIPAQLAKENKKFIYGIVREGARAKDYELALAWLSDCGLISIVHRASAPKIPLKSYEDFRAFKIYLSDVGLLSCMSGLKPETLLENSAIFTEFKGSLTEQFVLQQMKSSGLIRDICYWTNSSGTAEVDFLIERNGEVIPVEVKAGINLQSKSLKVYAEKYSPEIKLRFSMAEFKDEGILINLPLYAAEIAGRLIKRVS